MVKRSVIVAVQNYLKVLNEKGLQTNHAVIFGSFARGTPHKWSDIDVIVLSPRFDGRRKWSDVKLLYRSVAHADSRIEPIPCGEREWIEDDSRMIVEVARREGKVVTLAGPR